MKYKNPTKKDYIREFKQEYQVYCFEKRYDGKWVPLNRWYRPIGVSRHEQYDPDKAFALPMNKAVPGSVVKLDEYPLEGPNNNMVYVYRDDTAPWLSAAMEKRYQREVEKMWPNSGFWRD